MCAYFTVSWAPDLITFTLDCKQWLQIQKESETGNTIEIKRSGEVAEHTLCTQASGLQTFQASEPLNRPPPRLTIICHNSNVCMTMLYMRAYVYGAVQFAF